MNVQTSPTIRGEFRRRRRANRRGAAAVEMAIVAPIFFFLVMASFEFGRLNIIRHTADHAAYEAARHAMVPGATAKEARQHAAQALSLVGARGTSVDINPKKIDASVKEITVTIDIPLNQNGWVTPRFTSNKTIRAVSRLKTERSDE